MRCWLTETGRVAGREDMAVRQVIGLAFGGQLLLGAWLMLFSRAHRSVGDYLAGTVVVHDPDRVLRRDPVSGQLKDDVRRLRCWLRSRCRMLGGRQLPTAERRAAGRRSWFGMISWRDRVAAAGGFASRELNLCTDPGP